MRCVIPPLFWLGHSDGLGKPFAVVWEDPYVFNLRRREPDVARLNRLAERVLGVLERNKERVLLSGITAEYTGADVLRRIEKTKPVFKILSRKRGRVGILVPNSPGAALAILTTIAQGRIPVVLDASLRKDRIEKILAKMNLDFLIVSHAAYPELDAPCSMIKLNMAGNLVSLSTRRLRFGQSDLPREGTAVILYTSGSSGEPKGVQLSDTGISYTVDSLIKYFSLDRDSVSTCVLPLCHTMGLNTQFFPTFFAEGKCVFHQSSLSLRKIYRRIIESKGTFVGLIAELLQFCHEEKIRRDLEPAKLVRHVQIAGGVIRDDHLRMARELFPNAVIHKGYGLTEAIRISMISSEFPSFYEDTAGWPLPGQVVEIRGAKGEICQPGELGEIFVKGPNVMLGYDNGVDMPMLSDGFLATGDMGLLLSDGRLTIHGRHDSIFKVNGERVSGREIESTARAVEQMFQEVRCLPIDCEKRGVRPILFVEMNADSTLRFLRERKRDFEREIKMRLSDNMKIPRDVYIMRFFPRTANGKISNRLLSQIPQRREELSDLGLDSLGFQFFMVPDALTESDSSQEMALYDGSIA